jgi:citrate synthase
MPGWLAQWEEAILDREQRISRPRQIYVGPGPRHLPEDVAAAPAAS